jgi:glycosyltransferase involved in cell wall biosynthesis
LLFGADGGTSDPRKGFDLLIEALKYLRLQVEGTSLASLELVVFGQSKPLSTPDIDFPIHYAGRLHDDVTLSLLYSASDLFLIPSRQDNLPNTGLEAHACGTPVVAFRTGGLVDIVDEGITGMLAKPFDPSSLASAIIYILQDSRRLVDLGRASRARALRLWDASVVANQYMKLYDMIIRASP